MYGNTYYMITHVIGLIVVISTQFDKLHDPFAIRFIKLLNSTFIVFSYIVLVKHIFYNISQDMFIMVFFVSTCVLVLTIYKIYMSENIGSIRSYINKLKENGSSRC